MLFLTLLNCSKIFNEMQMTFVPEVLNFFTLFRSFPTITSISTNPTSTLYLSRSLVTVLCDSIGFIRGLALFLLMTRTLATVSSSSSDTDPFLNSTSLISLSWLVGLPSSSLGWRYSANSDPGSRHQPN